MSSTTNPTMDVMLPTTASVAAVRSAHAVETTWGMRRVCLVGLGALCVALGGIGIVVPGLPTTCFLLAASFLFAKAAPGLHRRLLANRRFGPYLHMARERRMPLRAKVASLLMMWGGIGLGSWATWEHGIVLPGVMAICGLVGTAVLVFCVGHEKVGAE